MRLFIYSVLLRLALLGGVVCSLQSTTLEDFAVSYQGGSITLKI